MSAISCRLYYQSASPHIQQLYTGFRLLQRSGFVRLSQQRRATPIQYESAAPHLKDAGHAHLDVLVNGKLRVHFDTHDAEELALGELGNCDFYFKRSYRPEVVNSLPADQQHKVLPLGLNYRVLPDVVDTLSMARALSLTGWSAPTLAAFKQALDTNNRLGFQPRVGLIQAEPDLRADPNVLFLVAAYDPYDDPHRSQEKIDDRIFINETRARCLRLLKDALGARFTGGFSHNRYAAEQYPDLVVPRGTTGQSQYLRTLRSFPICVATTGLHGSTGWKLAEYVAFSKAILSEKLVYEVPGTFTAEQNYIEFTSPEECLNGAVRLIENRALRQKLMQSNATYYREYLRPDALVRNALTTALEQR